MKVCDCFCAGGTKTPRIVAVVSLRCSATMGVFDVMIAYCVATLEYDAVRVDACIALFWLTHPAIRLAVGYSRTLRTPMRRNHYHYLCRVKPAMLDTPGSISKCRAMMQGNAR